MIFFHFQYIYKQIIANILKRIKLILYYKKELKFNCIEMDEGSIML
jgi:hypothetical protein